MLVIDLKLQTYTLISAWHGKHEIKEIGSITPVGLIAFPCKIRHLAVMDRRNKT